MVNPLRTTLLCTPKDRLHATASPSSVGQGGASGQPEGEGPGEDTDRDQTVKFGNYGFNSAFR